MKREKKRKILLLDGHSLAYRAFFALPDTLRTTSGQLTNAVLGFTSMLFKVLENIEPDSVVVTFDGPRKELLRTREYPEYKANRPPMPDELRDQITMINYLLQVMRIPTVTVPGYEADDILGSIAREVSSAGDHAVIVTGDRDILQLVDEGTEVIMTGRGITETELYDREAVIEKYGIPPEKIPDYIGLKGDSSDNIPGVPGIGKKGAADLVGRYGSLDEIYEHLDDISGAKRKKALEEHRTDAFLSRSLATIETGLSIESELIRQEFGIWDRQEVLDQLAALEFKTLSRRFLEVFGQGNDVESSEKAGDLDYSLVDPAMNVVLDSFYEEVQSSGAVAVSSSLSGEGYCDIKLESLAFATADKVLILSFNRDNFPSGAFESAGRILGSSCQKWFHDAKGTLQALDKEGISTKNVAFDTAVAAYLENPSLGAYYLWDLWDRNVGRRILVDGESEKEYDQPSLMEEEEEEEEIRLATRAVMIFHLKPVLEDKLDDLGMTELFQEVEMPLTGVLKNMEETGVAIDVPAIQELSRETGEKLERLGKDIHELAGHRFNISSTKQLSNVLFEEMGIPPVKKTKTGYSTDSSVLESLREEYPIAQKTLEYRENAKLKSTYYDVLPTLVCLESGKIHCTFNQTVTATGRISSSNPNLQNIPVRTDAGRRIRSSFIPGGEGCKLLIADYSQIELRVLAHMSGDEVLLNAFSKDDDIHRETASLLFGGSPDAITSGQRRIAKMVNFGVVYGMSYYGLAFRLGISTEEATEFIDTYFEKYPGVKRYRELCIEQAAEHGYAETLMKRRRYITQLYGKDRQTRELGERLAINTPIQGTAADIIKKAMVEVYSDLEREKMKSRMTLQVHDELIFDVVPDETEKLVGLVRKRMSGVAKLKVDLKVEIGIYDNWGQAK